MGLLRNTAVILFFLINVLFIAKASVHPAYPDFSVYYKASQLLLEQRNPYTDITPLFHMTFLYPPSLLLIIFPLALVSPHAMQMLWFFASLASLTASVFLLLRLLAIQKRFEVLVIFTFVFVMFPVKFTLGMGQINHVLLLFVTLCIYFLIRKKHALSGVTLAFAVSLKLFPVLFIPYFAYLKRWRALSSFFIITAILFILSWAVLGQDIVQDFFPSIVTGALSSWPKAYYNQAVSGFVVRLTENEDIRQILRLLLTISFIGISFSSIIRTKASKSTILLHIANVLSLSLLVNSFSWQHHFVFLIPSFLIMYAHIKKEKSRFNYFVALVIAFGLVSINIKNPDNFPAILQSHGFYGTVLLWAITLMFLRQHDT